MAREKNESAVCFMLSDKVKDGNLRGCSSGSRSGAWRMAALVVRRNPESRVSYPAPWDLSVEPQRWISRWRRRRIFPSQQRTAARSTAVCRYRISTFSAETVTLILREQYFWAGIIIFAHLAGSLAMTIFGIMTIRWLAQH